MDENKNHQGETLNENQLESVTGGNYATDANCYFEPQVPTESRVEHGKIFVKCKSRCQSDLKYCNCHGKAAQCVDKWHIVEHFAGDIWLPSPINLRNHSGARKAIRGLKM